MEPKDVKEFAVMVGKLFLAKGRAMPDGTIEVWFEDLSEFSIEKLRAGFKMMHRSPDDWLNTGKIIKFMTPNQGIEALDQFNLIDKYINRYVENGKDDTYRKWNEKAHRTLLLIGGPDRAYEATAKQFDFIRRDFIAMYEGVATEVEFATLEHTEAGKKIAGAMNGMREIA